MGVFCTPLMLMALSCDILAHAMHLELPERMIAFAVQLLQHCRQSDRVLGDRAGREIPFSTEQLFRVKAGSEKSEKEKERERECISTMLRERMMRWRD